MTARAWRFGQGTWGTAVVVGACGLAMVSSIAAGQTPRRRPAAIRRAVPPQGPWDPVTRSTFLDDAFTTLEGVRPEFGAVVRPTPVGAGARGNAAPDGGPAPEANASGAFAWSSLVSEGTLTDEIKEMKVAVAAACAKPSDFKGGGYDQARIAFSSIALSFGVIAAYDQDIRWKKDAAAARDLFARAGFNCKVGTDQSFAESKARLEDLEAMLDGGSPKGKPERDDDFRWSQVAGRPALMTRLEEAKATLRPGIASSGDFKSKVDDVLRAAEIVAAIGEVIQQPDFEYFDDDSYLGHAKEMRDAAAAVRDACAKGDYEAARTAAGRIEKSCDACHGEYRS